MKLLPFRPVTKLGVKSLEEVLGILPPPAPVNPSLDSKIIYMHVGDSPKASPESTRPPGLAEQAFWPETPSFADDSAFTHIPSLIITMERAEGPSIECHNLVTLHSWLAADEQLRLWARSIDGDYYDKTDVSVDLGGEDKWEYRFDLKRCATEGDGRDFRQNLVNRIAFYTGECRPAHMTAANYQSFTNGLDATTRDFAKHMLQRLGSMVPPAQPAAGSEALIPAAPPVLSPQEKQQQFLAMEDGYQPGAILCSSWGWEQTNIDFYRIEGRSGLMLTLVPLGNVLSETPGGFMSGTRVPTDIPKDYMTDHDVAWGNKDKENPKPTFRRKLRKYDGKISGIVVEHGWCKLWDATPMTCSWYA
jgi:hypothetical protein